MKNWVDLLRDTDSLKTLTIEVTDKEIKLDCDFEGEEIWLDKNQAEFLIVRLREAIRLLETSNATS